MYRFSEVVYDSASQTAEIGAGLIWDDVYAALDPYGVNVVGGRVSGVGVAGLILGGGSFHHFRMPARRSLYSSQVIHGKRINMV
jgi:FAD/FMN-containing dehydrogenase